MVAMAVVAVAEAEVDLKDVLILVGFMSLFAAFYDFLSCTQYFVCYI
jgi:hypothetical protein